VLWAVHLYSVGLVLRAFHHAGRVTRQHSGWQRPIKQAASGSQSPVFSSPAIHEISTFFAT